jgi:polyphosphate kinase 2 (PPK2 family)
MGEHSQENHRAELQRELEKHQAAVLDASNKLAAIAEGERREREAQELKARTLADLRKQLERCQLSIAFLQNKVTETKETIARCIQADCSGKGELLLPLKENFKDLAAWEFELAAFKAHEGSLRAKI